MRIAIFFLLSISCFCFTGCIAGGFAAGAYLADKAVNAAKGESDTCRCNYVTTTSIGGFDIVQMVEEGKKTLGQDQYYTVADNATYYFTNEANKVAFENDTDFFLSRYMFLGNNPMGLPKKECNPIKHGTIYLEGDNAESRRIFVFQNAKDLQFYQTNKATLMPAWKVQWKQLVKTSKHYDEPTTRKQVEIKEEKKPEATKEPASEEVTEKQE